MAEVVEVGGRRLSVLRKIADGGFSFVYLAEDERTKARYALKKIVCQTPAHVEEVRREIDAHAKFQHPNLLSLEAHSWHELASGAAVPARRAQRRQRRQGRVPVSSAELGAGYRDQTYAAAPSASADQVSTIAAGGGGVATADDLGLFEGEASPAATADSGAGLPVPPELPEGPDVEDTGAVEARLLFQLFSAGTLERAIERSARIGCSMPERVVLRLFRGVCAGVAAMHAAEPALAHRDIKPHNVLLSDEGIPVLMDFGSVRPAVAACPDNNARLAIQDDAARTCSMPYRAPELWDVPVGRGVNDKTDVWSLGCVLYALFFGYSPAEVRWRGNLPAVEEVSHLSVLREVFLPTSGIYADVASSRVREFILRLLQQDPARRPTAEAACHMCDRLLEGKPIQDAV